MAVSFQSDDVGSRLAHFELCGVERVMEQKTLARVYIDVRIDNFDEKLENQLLAKGSITCEISHLPTKTHFGTLSCHTSPSQQKLLVHELILLEPLR